MPSIDRRHSSVPVSPASLTTLKLESVPPFVRRPALNTSPEPSTATASPTALPLVLPSSAVSHAPAHLGAPTQSAATPSSSRWVRSFK